MDGIWSLLHNNHGTKNAIEIATGSYIHKRVLVCVKKSLRCQECERIVPGKARSWFRPVEVGLGIMHVPSMARKLKTQQPIGCCNMWRNGAHSEMSWHVRKASQGQVSVWSLMWSHMRWSSAVRKYLMSSGFIKPKMLCFNLARRKSKAQTTEWSIQGGRRIQQTRRRQDDNQRDRQTQTRKSRHQGGRNSSNRDNRESWAKKHQWIAPTYLVTCPSNKTWADSLRAARQHASNSASPFALSLLPKHQARHAPSDQGGTSRIFRKGRQVGTKELCRDISKLSKVLKRSWRFCCSSSKTHCYKIAYIHNNRKSIPNIIQCGPIAPTHSESLTQEPFIGKGNPHLAINFWLPRGHCLSSSYALDLSPDLKAKHYSRLASLKAESNYRDMYYSQHWHMQIEHQPQEQRSHNWKGCEPFLLNREVCFDRICNDVMLHPTWMRPAIQQKGQEAKPSLRKETKQLYTSWKIRGKSLSTTSRPKADRHLLTSANKSPGIATDYRSCLLRCRSECPKV